MRNASRFSLSAATTVELGRARQAAKALWFRFDPKFCVLMIYGDRAQVVVARLGRPGLARIIVMIDRSRLTLNACLIGKFGEHHRILPSFQIIPPDTILNGEPSFAGAVSPSDLPPAPPLWRQPVPNPIRTGVHHSIIDEVVLVGPRRCLAIVLSMMVTAGFAFAGDGETPSAAPEPQDAKIPKPAEATPKTATTAQEKGQPARTLESLLEAIERQTREITALKEQYAREMQQQQKRADLQQKQIEILQKTAGVLTDQVKTQAGEASTKDAIESLEAKTELLQSRAEQAAQRDLELAQFDDNIIEQFDAQKRYGPQLPAMLKGMFAPTPTNVSPVTIVNTLATRYDLFTHSRGAGTFEFQEYTPFFLVQLNKRVLLSGEMSWSPSGVSLGQAQADIFINDWLTMDIGYFLAPIGFWNERLDPEWINKLPDEPLVMRQVIPDGLVLTGMQFRGAKYLFGSPVKMEYSVFGTNAMGVPGMGARSDWADLGGVIGSTGNINQGAAYGGRLGFWIPSYGINFGASELANAPYSHLDGAVNSVWQPYFNYHRGNWDFRFEYGQNYERTKSFIDNNINRNGFYTQLAYRDYQSIHKQLQRLEYVFRFSDARFHGIDQASIAANVSSFATPMDAPVDRNQYTLGLNYYLYPSTIFKIAYEINQELHRDLKDNVLFMQFATNF